MIPKPVYMALNRSFSSYFLGAERVSCVSGGFWGHAHGARAGRRARGSVAMAASRARYGTSLGRATSSSGAKHGRSAVEPHKSSFFN